MFLFNKIFSSKINTEYPIYEDEEIDTILDEATISDMYEYKPVSSTMQVAFVLTGTNGIYFFMQSKADNQQQILNDIETSKKIYGLSSHGIYYFVKTPSKNYFSSEFKLYEVENIPERFVALYNNNLRPQIDLNYINFKSDYEKLFEPELPDEYKDESGNPVDIMDTGDVDYVASIISKTLLNDINRHIDEAEIDKDNGEIKYDENGQKYKKFAVKTKLFGYSYKDAWYPIAEDNPQLFALKTLLGGWFGLHKFITGEYLQGLLYFLTCGGFGIFYLFDILMIALGNYSIDRVDYIEVNGRVTKSKTKIYLDKLDNTKLMVIISLAGIIISYVSTNFIYINILQLLNTIFSNVMISTVETINAGV